MTTSNLTNISSNRDRDMKREENERNMRQGETERQIRRKRQIYVDTGRKTDKAEGETDRQTIRNVQHILDWRHTPAGNE